MTKHRYYNGSTPRIARERLENATSDDPTRYSGDKNVGAFFWEWTPLAENQAINVLIHVKELDLPQRRGVEVDPGDHGHAVIVYSLSGTTREIAGSKSRFDPEFWRAIVRAVDKQVAYDEAIVQLELADLAMAEVNRAMEAAGQLIDTIEEIDE